jgi:hypothetical protein
MSASIKNTNTSMRCLYGGMPRVSAFSETVKYVPCVLFLVFTAVAWSETAAQRILTYKQYASIQLKGPYILGFKAGAGALLFYGAEHTGDPKNLQIADIERRWGTFHPTFAYNEGGDPPTLDDAASAVKRYAEPGFLRYLAGRDHVPVATFEPSFDDEVSYALKRYSPQQVKMFYALRQVTEARVAAGSTSLDDRIKDWLTGYLPDHGLKNPPNNLEEFTVACKSLFPDLADWRKVSEDWFDPTQSGHYTNELANDTGVFRDQHIFRVLVDRVRGGDRVFAVIGSSHVVVQEPALLKEFGKPEIKVNGLP